MAAHRFVITGLVQGVFFRAQTKEKADELGLTGFVKNLPDGNVEVYAEGSEDTLKELEQWCWKGSPKAIVTDVCITEESERNLQSFEIWY